MVQRLLVENHLTEGHLVDKKGRKRLVCDVSNVYGAGKMSVGQIVFGINSRCQNIREPLLKGRICAIDLLIKTACLETFFCIKSTLSQIASTRRSAVLILHLQ